MLARRVPLDAALLSQATQPHPLPVSRASQPALGSADSPLAPGAWARQPRMAGEEAHTQAAKTSSPSRRVSVCGREGVAGSVSVCHHGRKWPFSPACANSPEAVHMA